MTCVACIQTPRHTIRPALEMPARNCEHTVVLEERDASAEPTIRSCRTLPAYRMIRNTQPVRRSIEVEYWVIDDEGRLVEPGSLVEATPGAEREFVEPLLEVKTTPCESTAELRAELLERLAAVLERADELDKGLVPLSTPLNQAEIEEISSERTRIQNEVIGEDFRYVRHCAGTHIHFEQQPGCTIDQLNTLIALDPAFGLVNSARHFQGEQLAVGARSKLYRQLAYDGLDGQGQLWPYVTDRQEWEMRLESRYKAFYERAIDAGLKDEAIESCFDPESAVWTPVQLRAEFGTVEWRSPDATLPSQIIQLAETMGEIIEQVRDTDVRIGQPARRTEDEIVIPPFETVTDYVYEAIREGLDSTALRSYLERMGFDIGAYEPLAADIESREISPSEARQLRVAYATDLHNDVVQRQPLEAD